MASRDRALVAITGANGTIGYASVLHALRTGYHVRCIVRREHAVAYIKRGPSLEQFADKVEFAVVPDNTISGAYDAALEGATYVVHIAGVWPMPTYHPDDEIYFPFVKSMENILSAAKKSGTVRRVVFTQAGAALVNPEDGDTLGNKMDHVLDEYVNVNPHSAAFRPPLPSPHHAYCGAKAYCTTYLRNVKTQYPFSIIQIMPGTVIGPSELVTSAHEAYTQMDRMSKALLFNEMKPRYAFGFVQVQDCASVHIEALDTTKVKNDEIPDWFVAAATTEQGKNVDQIWKRIGTMIQTEFSGQVKDGLFTVGVENFPVNMPYRVDSRLTERMLLGGKSFTGLEECIREVAKWYVGLVEKEKRI